MVKIVKWRCAVLSGTDEKRLKEENESLKIKNEKLSNKLQIGAEIFKLVTYAITKQNTIRRTSITGVHTGIHVE